MLYAMLAAGRSSIEALGSRAPALRFRARDAQ
jgi:hypothetical protein